MTRARTNIILPLTCAAAAIALGASDLMDVFALRPPGGETQQLLTAADRHHYALLVLAGFALIALAVALATGSKPAAIAVGVSGALALLIFCVVDLPKVGSVGTLNDVRQSFIEVKAYPVAGFWLELVGALVLAFAGAAFATLPKKP